MSLIPSEYAEQCTFVDWLEWNKLKFTAIPNATYTKSVKQKVKNKREGLRRGFPDLIVIIPWHRTEDQEGKLLCIEMKRTKGGSLQESQKEWIEALNLDVASPSVIAKVCKGADAAIEYVSKFLVN